MLPRTEIRKWPGYVLCACLCLGLVWSASYWSAMVVAQESDAAADVQAGPSGDPEHDSAADQQPTGGPANTERVSQEEGIRFFSLLVKGGWFMVPIALLSIVVVTVAIERGLALRRARVLPDPLIRELGRLAGTQGSFDPREAYRACQRYPSAAANVVRAMLLKIGRPHSEVEHTVSEASDREAERLYANVRWLNLAAGVAPLLGLLGTVWGMIDAFHRTTILAPGQNKAEELASGIYIALVTTLAGLMVAIPAAVLSHMFEGRIQRLFHLIDELLFSLLPQIERFEGRMRFGQHLGDGQKQTGPPEPPHVATPPRGN